MNTIAGFSGAIDRLTAYYKPTAPASVSEGRGRPDVIDVVELTGSARSARLSNQSQGPEIRRLFLVRQAIQDGTYETPERIEGTVDRLLNVLA